MAHLFNQLKYIPKNNSVRWLIGDFEREYQPLFNKVKSQWLPAIREFLREETGLRMHQKIVGYKIKKDSNVSFNFVPDRHDTFIKLVDENYPDLDFNEYSIFRSLKSELTNAKFFFADNVDKPGSEYQALASYLDSYFEKYNLDSLLNTLFKTSGRSADIWGTYYFRDGRIDIYFLPLILFSKIHNIPLEQAIISTLVHEVAHAYHHMGKDKDNVTWVSMDRTDLKIVEGMAEYFTWLFIETYKSNHSGMELTYNKMFKCLGPEYTIFKDWTSVYSKEAIKSALLGTRRKSILDYQGFENLLRNVKIIMH